MPGQRHLGPADVVEAARRGDSRMPLGAGLLSAAASILSIGAGASVGRYGPAVHLGGTLGAWLASVFRLQRPARCELAGRGLRGRGNGGGGKPGRRRAHRDHLNRI